MSARDQSTFARYMAQSSAFGDPQPVAIAPRPRGESSVKQGSNCLDGHQENALSQRRGDEAMPFVKGYRFVVDRMHDDGADTGDFRGGRAAAESVGEQVGAQADPLECGIDGQPGDEKQRHLVGHALSQLRRGERGPLLHCGGDGVVSHNPTGSAGVADDIGASRGAFTGDGALIEPMIERGVPSIMKRLDVMVSVQSFRPRNLALGHGNERRVRSSIPERFALHQLLELRRRHGRRIEKAQKLLVLLGVQKEGPLIEDGGLGFPSRARKHELGQLLPAQGSSTAEHRLELSRGPDLDDIVLTRRGASVGTGVLCHVAKLLANIWRFATTLSIQTGRPRRRLTVLCLATLFAFPPSVSAQGAPTAIPSRQGYWWYEAPKPKAEDKAEPDALVKPVIPPMAELATWTPPKIRKLIEEQRDYAATVLTVDAVADFWRLQDFARRKARAFAGVTQIAMLQYPELNSKSANPMVGDARSELTAEKDGIRRAYLRAHAGEFALVMFSRSTCGYCRVQWPIIQRFQEEMGWQVTLMDIDRRPELAERFGVQITPTTMVIRRGSQQRMIIASGVEAYPNLAQMAYQAVRLLRGDIRPEQFMTGPGEDAGFFDALGNGPVSATDPRALGGDLVEISHEPRQ